MDPTRRNRSNAKAGAQATGKNEVVSPAIKKLGEIHPTDKERGEDKENIQVPIIGWSRRFDDDAKHIKKVAKKLKASVIENPREYARITHFIASEWGNPMSATYEAVLAYQYTSNLVTLDWLLDSGDSEQILSCEKYMAIHNEDGERAPGGVLAGQYVYVCIGGSGKLTVQEWNQLIEAAGATPVTLNSMERCDVSQLIIVMHELGAMLPIRVENAIEMGARNMLPGDFFDILMPENIVIDPNNTVKHPTAPDSPPQNVPPINAQRESSSSRVADCQSTIKQQTHRKPTSKPKSKKPSQKKHVGLPKIYEVDSDRTMLQTSKEKAVETLMKFGFNSDFGQYSSDSAMARNQVQKTNTNAKADLRLLFSTQLSISPTRSISNRNIGDPNREFLGDNGMLEIFISSKTNRITVCYSDSNGVKKFEAVVPRSEPHKPIFGNSGEQNCFVWDAQNRAFSSGGTTIMGAKNASGLRRFFFWFTSIQQLSIALFFVFNQDMALVDEFFDKGGRFYADVVTRPPHVKDFAIATGSCINF